MPYGYSPLKLVPAGPWAPDGVYVAGQVLLRNGSTYWAHRTPTVGNDPEINSPDEWQLLAAKGAKGDRGDVVWRGPHSMGTLYEIDDAVESGGSAWIATVQNQGHAPPDPAYWDLFAAAGGQGPAGSAWYVGSGVPSAETGNDGDRYLDGVTGNVYAKADGAWTLAGSLKGPAGTDGAASLPAANYAGMFLGGSIDLRNLTAAQTVLVGGNPNITEVIAADMANLGYLDCAGNTGMTAVNFSGTKVGTGAVILTGCTALTNINGANAGLTAEQVVSILAAAVVADAAQGAGGTLNLAGAAAIPDFDVPSLYVSGTADGAYDGEYDYQGTDGGYHPHWVNTQNGLVLSYGWSTGYHMTEQGGVDGPYNGLMLFEGQDHIAVGVAVGECHDPSCTLYPLDPSGYPDTQQSSVGTVSVNSYGQPWQDYQTLLSHSWTVTL